MSGLINRQDAIDAVCMEWCNVKHEDCQHKQYNEGMIWWCIGCETVFSILPNVPSVEQKTGHWVEVSGYATPGGDPVWRCSECGKGTHVYGIEASTYAKDMVDNHQWVSCPNCGAEMIGD